MLKYFSSALVVTLVDKPVTYRLFPGLAIASESLLLEKLEINCHMEQMSNKNNHRCNKYPCVIIYEAWVLQKTCLVEYILGTTPSACELKTQNRVFKLFLRQSFFLFLYLSDVYANRDSTFLYAERT